MAQPEPTDRGFTRVPEYAWAWLQRSRPVLTEVAVRLTGSAPQPGFVEELRRLYQDDPFSRDVVLGSVVDVAFRGRVPTARPPGASWDRGLVWWAAAATGRRPRDFDRAPAPQDRQRALFDAGGVEAREVAGGRGPAAGQRRTPSADRAELVWRLRSLVRDARDDVIPVAAVRALLADLETGPPPDSPAEANR